MVVIFLPLILLSLSTYFLSVHILETKIRESLDNNLSYIGQRVEDELDQVEEVTNFFFSNEELKKIIRKDYDQLSESEKYYDYKGIQNTLSSFSTFEVFQYLQLIYIYGTNQEEFIYGVDANIFSFNKNKLHESEPFNEAIQLKGQLLCNGLQNNYVNHENHNSKVVSFYRAIIENNKHLGTMYIEVSNNFFKYILSNDDFQVGNKLYLVDHNNHIVFSNESTQIGQVYTKAEDALLVEYKIPKYNWMLISSIKKTTLTDEYTIIMRIILLMASITLLSSGIIIFFITKRIVDPIKYLMGSIEKVKEGDFNTRVSYQSSDEIGVLTENFNYMTERIQGLFQDVVEQTNKRQDAEYKALQAQINPHFLYNTLNFIRWMAIIQKADNIKNMVDALSQLLKNISNKRETLISISEELEILDYYIKIQDIRYKGKFEVNYHVENLIGDLKCPKFILQPIVENAIFHGIEPKEDTGVIDIDIYEMDNQVYIEITDNGVGMTQEQIGNILINSEKHEKGRKGFNSIGIYNVHERIRLFFSNDYGISIKSELGSYTTIVVKIPIINDESEWEKKWNNYIES